MEYFGKVAKCKHGKLGIIYGQIMDYKDVEQGTLIYIGVNLDGSKWQSKDPDILADNIDQYITEQFSWRGLEE